MPNWRQIAVSAIEKAYKEAVAENKQGNEIVKTIDAAYPFGVRAMHPYKIWLSARKRALYQLGLYDGRGRVMPKDKIFTVDTSPTFLEKEEAAR